MITAISGLPGSGKTEWIRKQIAQKQEEAVYFSPQTASFPIDDLRLQSRESKVRVFFTGGIEELSKFAQTGGEVYLELPWHLDLLASESLLQKLNCHRVAIISSPEDCFEWQSWADEIVFNYRPGIDQWLSRLEKHQLKIQQALLRGEVLDFASLETFWQELIEGAYGEVFRAKGIFDLAQGECIYGEFSCGLPLQEFESLQLPLNLNGRPERFSGLEIIGDNLDQEAIADTLGDCCLSDEAIFYYQQQIKQSLSSQEEEIG